MCVTYAVQGGPPLTVRVLEDRGGGVVGEDKLGAGRDRVEEWGVAENIYVFKARGGRLPPADRLGGGQRLLHRVHECGAEETGIGT
jgi:hypothetical protein